jgi:ectoine hydroxylase-related dioxygenase (phytanoyl-CoA dioxygenase family)
MRRIADACFGDSPYQFNHQIFVHRTDRTMSPPSGELHFDVTRMLKFWLYLSDGTQANGAMRAAPGSNLWLKHVRREYSDRLIPKSQIRNTVDESALRAIHLVGPPGTLFIFDTDVAHGASPVAQGGQRRIMRSHCTEDLFASRARLRGS